MLYIIKLIYSRLKRIIELYNKNSYNYDVVIANSYLYSTIATLNLLHMRIAKQHGSIQDYVFFYNYVSVTMVL
jgi:hypothetical protein